MTSLTASPVLLSSAGLVAAVAVLLLAEARASSLGVWLAKPIASTLFVVVALLGGALSSPFGKLMLIGLILSWLGDVFLIPKKPQFFIAGLGSFLLAHLAYSGAFLAQPGSGLLVASAAVAMAVFAGVVMRWLLPHVPRRLRSAVLSYVAAISLMVVLAAGTAAAIGPSLVAGAALFAISDLFVARDRFVSPSVINRLCGLPLYYSAQLVFALSIR